MAQPVERDIEVERAAIVRFIEDRKGPNDMNISLLGGFSTEALVDDCEINASPPRDRDHFLFARPKVAQRGINPGCFENSNPFRRFRPESANRVRRFVVP